MAECVKSRRYVSPRREEQARQTRREILAAALRRFVADGYAATRVEDVAREAGVAVQTVYRSVGGKRDLLWSVLEVAVAGDDEPVTVENRFREALDGGADQHERLRRAVALGRGLMERSSDAYRIMRSAAAADPSLASALTEVEERRRTDAHAVAAMIAGERAAHRGPELAAFADYFYALTGYEVYEHLIKTCGWSGDQYEDRILRSLVTALDA